MFVQSARTVAEHGPSPTERLARMNLAVHGLEGDIRQAITYYEDPHELLGRADFVMSSQASSAGGEAKISRRRLVETGDVDVVIAIRSNFFYTRTAPCELWFLNRAKPEERRDKVLMIDARNVYRQVTRKICDFSPEQQQNLLAIVWLYRGETDKYHALVASYRRRSLAAARNLQPVHDFQTAMEDLASQCEVGSLKGDTSTC